MKLVASLMVAEVEPERYLVPCVESLLSFCDEVVMLFDGDGKWALGLEDVWGTDGQRITGGLPGPGVEPVDFFAHEGRARNRLLTLTLGREPTHVLAIDADEFVSDGMDMRRRIEADTNGQVWSLDMQEVWQVDGDCLCIREDGGWRSHAVPVVWRAPPKDVDRPQLWRIQDTALACGREPIAVRMLSGYAADTGADVLHFGWANEGERAARHQRYVVADGGRFHANTHLDSIMWPDERVRLRGREWPAALAGQRDAITAYATKGA